MSESRAAPPSTERRIGAGSWLAFGLGTALLLFLAWRFLKGLEANVNGGDWDAVVRELKICASLFGALLAITSIWLATILHRVGDAAIKERRFPPQHDPGLHAKNVLLGEAAVVRGQKVRRLAIAVGATGVIVAILGAAFVLRL